MAILRKRQRVRVFGAEETESRMARSWSGGFILPPREAIRGWPAGWWCGRRSPGNNLTGCSARREGRCRIRGSETRQKLPAPTRVTVA